MKYNLNFKKIITDNIPFVMRLALVDLLIVLTLPVKELHIRFKDFRLAVLNKLSYNAQYPNLQRLLNDRYDSTQRRIKVYDSPNIVNTCLAYPSGQFGKQQLKTNFIIKSWRSWGYRPFVVDISQMPSWFKDAEDNVNQIAKIVNIYKFSGTKYSIKTI